METANNDKALQAVKSSLNEGSHGITTAGLRAAKAVARDEGVSDVTIWRRVRSGLLISVNIAGRPYITNASLAEFYRRAATGEFAKPPAGAAGKSAEARAAQERRGPKKTDTQFAAVGDFSLKRRGSRNMH
jgi:hypothetical protein